MGGGHSTLKKARESEKAATRMFAHIDAQAKGFVNKSDLITQMERYGHTTFTATGRWRTSRRL